MSLINHHRTVVSMKGHLPLSPKAHGVQLSSPDNCNLQLIIPQDLVLWHIGSQANHTAYLFVFEKARQSLVGSGCTTQLSQLEFLPAEACY